MSWIGLLSPCTSIVVILRCERAPRAERIDPLGGQELRQFSKLFLCQKLASSKALRTFERRIGLGRPEPLEIRLAVRCPRDNPSLGRLGLSNTGSCQQHEARHEHDALHCVTSA